MKTSKAVKKKDRRRVIVVVGGAGAMGRIVVRDLVETAGPAFSVIIADANAPAAEALARGYASKRVSASFCDVTRVKKTARLLDGAFAVINAAHHRFNLEVMKSALLAGTHYVDLGGLFHTTRRQLLLSRAFADSERLALLGMGAAPGITNLLARSAADRMDEVHEIHCYVGNVDLRPSAPSAPLATSYSIQTVLEEASAPAAIFTEGAFRFVEAMSGREVVRFPEPVGLKHPSLTLHSEVATLPLSYRDKGIREASFRIAFPDDLDQQLRFLRAIGMLSTEPLSIEAGEVAPRDYLVRVLARLPRSAPSGPPDEYEVLRSVVRGTIAGREAEEIVECHTSGVPEWGIGIDVDTGCPPSIAVQMLARGEIQAVGVEPPERVVPVEPFFRALEERGMKVLRS